MVTGVLCVIGTLGFESANFIRPLLALGLRGDYKLVLVSSSAGGEYESERAERAIREVETIIGKKATVLRYSASLEDLPKMTHDIAMHCRETEKIIAVLAGGLRPLILLTLSAVLLLWRFKGLKAEIATMREDGLAFFTLGPEYFSIPELGEREAEVLDILASHGGVMRRSELIKYLRTRLGTSHVIIYRRLRSLERKRLVVIEDDNVRITHLGLAIVEALTNES